MLLISIIFLLMAIPLFSSSITPILLIRITSIILLYAAALSYNVLYINTISSGLGLYSGLFNVSSLTLYMQIFLLIVGSLIMMVWAPVLMYVPTAKVLGQNIRRHIAAEYSLIILFTTTGACFLISSADLISMFLSIELQSYGVYILAASYKDSESATSAGLKYFLLGALSSAFILLGASLIYAYTGLTQFESLFSLASVPSAGLTSSAGLEGWSQIGFSGTEWILVFSAMIIAIGFLFKVAAAPFHNWAPDVYDGVPTIVTTWLTVMPKISIFVLAISLWLSLPYSGLLHSAVQGGDNLTLFSFFILLSSFLSLVIGTLLGLSQYKIKRLLAYSTVANVGYLLLALSVNNIDSINSMLFYLMQYSLVNANALFVLLAFGYCAATHSITTRGRGQAVVNKHKNPTLVAKTDIEFIKELSAQIHHNPLLSFSLALSLFSMAGIPPLVGFFAKYFVLYSAIENGYYFISLVAILTSVISAYYYLKVIGVLHFSSTPSDVEATLENKTTTLESLPSSVTSIHAYVIGLLTLFILFFVINPSLILNSTKLLAIILFTT